MEKWKKIENFPYEVSDLGRVRRDTPGKSTRVGKILKPSTQSKGYLCVVLTKNGKMHSKLVHVLVAKAFIPNPLNLPQVNHLGDNADCRAKMLEWRSGTGNMRHAVKTRRKAETGVVFDKGAKGTKKWRARYNPSPYKRVSLGYFSTKKEALSARKRAVETLPNIL